MRKYIIISVDLAEMGEVSLADMGEVELKNLFLVDHIQRPAVDLNHVNWI